MNIWSVLGIEETKDKDLLKTAYREKLKDVNPEDDQQGFMRLREAYEEALRLADRVPLEKVFNIRRNDNEFPFPVKDELREVYYELDNLYKDYPRRIDEENWREIFNRDEFISLDSSSDAFEMLIRFLMINFLLPHNIWEIIVDTFDIKKRKIELSEKFPKDFLDFVIDNSENIDIFNYYLFDNDVDSEKTDEFIKNYLTMNTAIRRNDQDEAKKLMETLEDMEIYHPYLELSRIRIMLHEADEFDHKEIYEAAKNLYDECPDDFNITCLCGDLALLLKNIEDAERFYEEIKEMEPESTAVKIKFADLAYFKGDFEASRDAYMELLRENNYDNNIRAGMLRANISLIEENKKKLLLDPDNADIKIEIAWSYYQSYKFEEAVNILDGFEPKEEKRFEYYNVKGRSYLCLLDYRSALSCFFRWKEEIEALPKDGDEEIIKKRKRLPYVNFLIADCYLKLKNYEKAELLLNMALSVPHDEIVLSYEANCELKYETGKYEDCLIACEKLLENSGDNYIAYEYMAKSFFELNYIKEAIDACENAIKIYPYAPEPYSLEIEIFLKIGLIDTAKKIIEKYKSLGILSEQIKAYETLVLVKEEKCDEAKILLNELEESELDDSDLTSLLPVYSELARYYEKYNNLSEELHYLKCILSENSNYEFVEGRIGVVYEKLKQYSKAQIFLDRQNKKITKAQFLLASANVKRAMGKFSLAAREYEYVISKDPGNTECYIAAASLYEFLGNLDKAYLYYKKAVEYINEEKKPFLYLSLARVLQGLKQYELARKTYMEYIDKYEICYDLVYDYSVLLQRINESDEAIAFILKYIDCIKDAKEEQILLERLCTIYANEGYLNNANETFDVIISKYPNDYKAYKIMADAFYYQGLYNVATGYYEKAISLDIEKKENYYIDLVENEINKSVFSRTAVKPLIKTALEISEKRKTIKDYIKLAKVYRITKKYKLAIQAIEEGLKVTKRCIGCFYSDCHEMYYEKGRIYEAVKEYDTARECYKQALGICGHNTLYEESLKRIDGK